MPDIKPLLSLLLVFLLFAQVAVADGFRLKKTDSGVESEMCWDNKGFALPGADMIAGEFRYVYDKDNEESCKAGVLIKGRILYYVADMEKKVVNGVVTVYDNRSLDIGGETNYGVYGNYLVMDSFPYGTVSGGDRMMFLFKYGNDTVELLDVIDPGVNFQSVEDDASVVNIRDLDNDGNPEFKITTVPGLRHSFEYFLTIKDDRLHVNLNPALYKPIFKRQKLKNPSKKKRDAYYISGFLAGALTLDDVKSAIRFNGEKYDGQHDSVVKKIIKRDAWDIEFHEQYGTQPTLLRYEVKGR